MTSPSYWWAALCVAGVITVLLATDPLRRTTQARLIVFRFGIGAALLGIGGLLHEFWRIQ